MNSRMKLSKIASLHFRNIKNWKPDAEVLIKESKRSQSHIEVECDFDLLISLFNESDCLRIGDWQYNSDSRIFTCGHPQLAKEMLASEVKPGLFSINIRAISIIMAMRAIEFLVMKDTGDKPRLFKSADLSWECRFSKADDACVYVSKTLSLAESSKQLDIVSKYLQDLHLDPAKILSVVNSQKEPGSQRLRIDLYEVADNMKIPEPKTLKELSCYEEDVNDSKNVFAFK